MPLNINGTTGISGVDGSVSSPAVTGTDSNTGITFPSADTIKFSTGGVERMQITNSGVSGTGIGGGKILQVVSTTTDAYAAQDSPANTKLGNLTVNVQITPSATTSKILLFYSISLSAEVVGREVSLTPTVYDGSSYTEFALGASSGSKTRVNTLDVQPNAGVQRQFNISFHCTHEPNTTSQRTYGFRHTVQHDGGWIVRNQAFTSPDNSGSARSVSTVTAMEIGA